MAHRLSPEAEAGLDEVWRYIARESGSVETARAVVSSITERIHFLSDYPRIGRRRDDLRPGLRSYPAGNYVILYRIEGAGVVIVHIFHGRRDIEGLFGPSSQ
jgi:toxin ParE1/3/4